MISAEADYKLGRSTSKPCILVVDDEEDILRPILTCIIRHYHGRYEPVICIDGDEAISAIKRNLIAMIVLDIRMPNVDGIAVCSYLHDHPIYSKIPVLISSGYIDDELKEQLKPLGINHFLDKPYSMSTLTEKIDRILEDESFIF